MIWLNWLLFSAYFDMMCVVNWHYTNKLNWIVLYLLRHLCYLLVLHVVMEPIFFQWERDRIFKNNSINYISRCFTKDTNQSLVIKTTHLLHMSIRFKLLHHIRMLNTVKIIYITVLLSCWKVNLCLCVKSASKRFSSWIALSRILPCVSKIMNQFSSSSQLCATLH